MRQSVTGLSRAIAAFAAVSLALSGLVPVTAQAGTPAASSLTGRIFLADSTTPVPGAVVRAFHRQTEQVFSSPASGRDGAYEISGLPAGLYDLAVSDQAGVYLLDEPVRVAAGRTRGASFALQPEGDEPAGAPPQTPEPPAKQPPANEPPAKEPPVKRKSKRPAAGSAASRALVATSIIVGGAVVVGALASNLSNDDNDSDGSPN